MVHRSGDHAGEAEIPSPGSRAIQRRRCDSLGKLNVTAEPCLRYVAPAGGLQLPWLLGLETVPRGRVGQENAVTVSRLGRCSPNTKAAPRPSSSTQVRPCLCTPARSRTWGLLEREVIQMGFLFLPSRRGWEPAASFMRVGSVCRARMAWSGLGASYRPHGPPPSLFLPLPELSPPAWPQGPGCLP